MSLSPEKEILKRVRRLEIKSRGLSSEIFAGQYHSAFRGRGMSFSEVREYRAGDDVRDIDWNVTARSSKPHIKIYEEERELTVMLLVDVSGSSDFGTQGQTKRALQTEIAAVLAFSAAQTGDKVGLMMFAGGVEKFIPPAKGRGHVLRIIRELIGAQEAANFRGRKPEPSRGAEGRSLSLNFLSERSSPAATRRRISEKIATDEANGTPIKARADRFATDEANEQTLLSEPIRHLTNALPKRSTAFVLSDFLYPADDEPRLRDALKIASGKHDIVAIRVWDKREGELPNVGVLEARDLESGARAWVDTSSRRARDEYYVKWSARTERTRELLRHYKIDTAHVATGEDYVRELVKLFKKR